MAHDCTPHGTPRVTTLVGQDALDFTAQAVVNGQFEDVTLSSYKGKNVVLFFWPLDFTFVCPTEVVAFSDAAAEFEKRNTQLLGVSIDSAFVHLAWQNTDKAKGGVGPCNFPMIADTTHSIAKSYGVLIKDAGIAFRGLFLIDSEGKVRHSLVNDLPLGRSVDEALRMVDALAFFEENGEVCPANWKPGASTIKPDVSGSQSFFQEWGG